MESMRPPQEPVATFDWTETESVSEAVVSAVAEHRNADPVTFPPLYESIDPDALNDLFRPAIKLSTLPTTTVQFRYAGYLVVLKEHGLGYPLEQSIGKSTVKTAHKNHCTLPPSKQPASEPSSIKRIRSAVPMTRIINAAYLGLAVPTQSLHVSIPSPIHNDDIVTQSSISPSENA